MLRLLAPLAFLLALPLAAQPLDMLRIDTLRIEMLRTRAETSDYRATSSYADVMDFVEAVDAQPGFHATTFGETVEGRALPLVVWGAHGAAADDVKASGKLRVFVMANIHAGEVAGKEAALILLREIASGTHAAWADSLTLLVAPIYNADGNERLDPDNRPFQHGPVDGMGQRPNAQDLDLNRDFVKLDAPESRALTRLFNVYDPHVIVDLHTTDGTIHGYDLTYAPPLHPSTPAGIDSLLREAWLPAVTEGYKSRYGGDLTYYGNDKPEWGQPSGWATFDPRPRFGTNIAGLRNRVGILSEVYSYATFEDRVMATLGFVTEVLDWAHGHAGEIRAVVQAADTESVVGQPLAMRSAGHWQAEPEPQPILLGEVMEEPNPHTGSIMLRRTDVKTPTPMTVYGRFEGAEPVRAPAAYILPDSPVGTERLKLHGIRSYPVTAGIAFTAEAFHVDSVQTAERPFQNRYEQTLFGRYASESFLSDARMRIVPVDQPLGRLAVLLLEPRSDSGFAGWGLVRPEAGAVYAVLRVPSPQEVQRLVQPPE